MGWYFPPWILVVYCFTMKERKSLTDNAPPVTKRRSCYGNGKRLLLVLAHLFAAGGVCVQTRAYWRANITATPHLSYYYPMLVLQQRTATPTPSRQCWFRATLHTNPLHATATLHTDPLHAMLVLQHSFTPLPNAGSTATHCYETCPLHLTRA